MFCVGAVINWHLVGSGFFGQSVPVSGCGVGGCCVSCVIHGNIGPAVQ